ncbi:enoyl-CoA hydratase/isomerase family protein [Sphingosinicellaceae bacterium]|nr:enoyl-CoA hydratase/isomerase family protein [Sphingosinicellaceae bacterium]
MSDAGAVTWTIDGHVATVLLDRPPHNHVNLEVMTALADTLATLDADERCRAVVLTTAGKVFCGGADLASPDGLLSGGEAGLAPFYGQAARLFGTRKPIIAAVQGAAVGAGLGLALVADFRVASPEARFTANFVKLGFHAGFGITHTLPRAIGVQRAGLMLQTGRRIKADEALAWGLVDVVASGTELVAAAQALAAEIAENAPLAVEATRATLRAGLVEAFQGQTRHELAQQARLMATTDFAEGVRAVTERRVGAFTGR